ncbi:MAG: Ig-like domain-containing protein, partial [Dehalococcoidia bacterium]
MNKFRYLVFVLSVTVLLIGGSIFPQVALADSVSVTVNAPSQVLVGSTFSATIDIGQVTELNAAQVDVTYDNSVLQLNSVSNGLIGSTTIVPMSNQVDSDTRRVIVSMGLGTVSGTGTLATLNFLAIGAAGASSNIQLSNGLLSGMSGSIAATWTGDSVLLYEQDTTPPTVTTTSPANGAPSVAINTPVAVTFSETMNQTSAEGAFSINPAVPGTFSWEGNIMTFTPGGDSGSHLAYSTAYAVTVGTGAQDLAGNPLASPYNFTFTTANPPIVINEFMANPTTGTEWIELYNPTADQVNLAGWTIEDNTGSTYGSGAGNTSLTGKTIAAGSYLLLTKGTDFSFVLNNDNDVIILKNGTAQVDKVAYGNFADGNTTDNAPAPAQGKSTGRCPNGADTNVDNVDFKVLDIPTPGAVNICVAHTVTFNLGTHGTQTGGGALVQTVAHGSAATAPEVQANDGWTFTGWDKAFTNVTSDLTVTAQYTQITHTVTFNLGTHGTQTGGG